MSKTNDRKDLEWEEIKTEHIVKNEWIDFRQSAFRFPDGTVFEPYYNYSRKDYVVIVPFDKEGNLICVRQYRQGIRKVTCEFPAGGIENDDAFEAAERELIEETGYKSSEWKFLLKVPSNATIADNYAYLYVARNCRKVADQSLDETEFLNVEKYSSNEIDNLIAEGKFEQAVHIAAWLLAKSGS